MGSGNAPTVNIYFDGRMSKEDEFYVKYAVYFQGKQRYYATATKLDKEDVEFLKKYKTGLTGGVRDEYRRNLWNMIYGQTYIHPVTGRATVSILRRGREVAGELGLKFSFEAFAKGIAAPPPEGNKKVGSLTADMSEYAARLRRTDNIGDANLYESAVVSLARFTNKDEVLYDDVTVDFLNRYEAWMLREGKAAQPKKGKNGQLMKRPGTPASITTVGMYLRQVRSMFNISKTSDRHYPFGEGGYTIPSSRNIKKALSKEDIGKIISYEPKSPGEGQARDLWLFSYLSNGINFLDMLSIKWDSFSQRDMTIQFVRSKTKGTKKSRLSNVQIDLFPISIEIIERWGDKRNEYIFPFFSKDMTVERKKEVNSQVVKNTNKYMRRIAEALGITADITTYTARHSFATILMRSEAPLAFIQGKLDHGSLNTTQNYLGSFESDQAKKYLANLLPDDPKPSS